jgi:hypothetical protein
VPLLLFQTTAAIVLRRRFLPPFPVTAGTNSLQNTVTFCMNSDEDKIYMIIVAFDEIYNFVVQAFLIPSHPWTQKIHILSLWAGQ